MGDSVAMANRGAVFLEVGGSNGQGDPETDAPALVKPANVTYYNDGIEVADYATLTQHGMAVYMLDELCTVLGYSGAIVYFNSCIAATDVDTWLSTHGATAIGHVTAVSASLRPNWVILDQGATDAQGAPDADSYPGDSLDLFEQFATRFGAAIARIIIGLAVAQDGTYIHADQLRASQAAMARDANDCCLFFSCAGVSTIDGVHRTVSANEALGRAVARAVHSSGILP